MNDQVRKELMIVVERAVRPVRASVYHKRRMREELLEHLSAVLDNEMELQDDIQTGLERAKQRFGDPIKLTEELQQTVPWWDRARSLCDIGRLEPGESMTHFLATKWILFVLANYVIYLLAMLPAMMWTKVGDIGIMLRGMFVISTLMSIGGFLLIFVLSRIGLALYGDEQQRSRWAAARWMLIAIFAFPVLFLFAYIAMSGDLGQSLVRFKLACCLSPIFTLLLLPMSRQWFDEFQPEVEWANLKLDE